MKALVSWFLWSILFVATGIFAIGWRRSFTQYDFWGWFPSESIARGIRVSNGKAVIFQNVNAGPGYYPARAVAEGHFVGRPMPFDGYPLVTHGSREVIRLMGPRANMGPAIPMPVVWSCLGIECRLEYSKYGGYWYLIVPLAWPTFLLLLFWTCSTLKITLRIRRNWKQRCCCAPGFPLDS